MQTIICPPLHHNDTASAAGPTFVSFFFTKIMILDLWIFQRRWLWGFFSRTMVRQYRVLDDFPCAVKNEQLAQVMETRRQQHANCLYCWFDLKFWSIFKRKRGLWKEKKNALSTYIQIALLRLNCLIRIFCFKWHLRSVSKEAELLEKKEIQMERGSRYGMPLGSDTD